MKLDKAEKRIIAAMFIAITTLIYSIITASILDTAVFECRSQGYETAVIDFFTHETKCKYPMYIQDKL